MLHHLFSTNKHGWSHWSFEQYVLKTGQTVLELGCGNGGTWAANVDRIPQGIEVTLSDISAGMLDAAKANTSALQNAQYRVIDAQEIPFADASFDVVIANHMLYHVPRVDKALEEIARVLKPGGTLYATTIGNGNFNELARILEAFDSRIDWAATMKAITDAFGLESGAAMLAQYFGGVETRRHADSLHITEAQPLIDYVLSMTEIGNVTELVRERSVAFADYIEGLLKETGYIDIAKDAGMLIAGK